MNMNDLRLRNKSTHARGLVIFIVHGEEKRKEYTQDAYNQIYVQKCHTNIVVYCEPEALIIVIDPEQLRWLEVS